METDNHKNLRLKSDSVPPRSIGKSGRIPFGRVLTPFFSASPLPFRRRLLWLALFHAERISWN